MPYHLLPLIIEGIRFRKIIAQKDVIIKQYLTYLTDSLKLKQKLKVTPTALLKSAWCTVGKQSPKQHHPPVLHQLTAVIQAHRRGLYRQVDHATYSQRSIARLYNISLDSTTRQFSWLHEWVRLLRWWAIWRWWPALKQIKYQLLRGRCESRWIVKWWGRDSIVLE